jgi:large subunit ribosomal protein L18
MEDPLMARGPTYRVAFRRRREGKTDYKARRALIVSKLPRVVTRPSLKHMNVQVVEATPSGDKIIASANSQELQTYGWQAPCGNVPSAYLTGLLCGRRAATQNVRKVVADIGLSQPTKGARVFAALKGVVDAGVEVPHDSEKLPDEKRMTGQHIATYAKHLATSDSERYHTAFSKYLQAKLAPEDLAEHFAAAREKITGQTGEEKQKKKSRSKEGRSKTTTRRKRSRKKSEKT